MRVVCKRSTSPDINAYRYAEQIIEPVISTIPVALEVGRNVMDDNEPLIPVTLTSVYVPTKTGDLLEVSDELQANVWRAECTGVELRLGQDGRFTVTQQLLRRV